MDKACMNTGCGCWDRKSPDNCIANCADGNSEQCESRTTTPTESISSERLAELEDKEKWYNPPEGEWEMSATIGRQQAQVDEQSKTISKLEARISSLKDDANCTDTLWVYNRILGWEREDEVQPQTKETA
jgi:hypothetical protein